MIVPPKTEVDKVREAYAHDHHVTDAQYGRLIEEAQAADEAREREAEAEAERPDWDRELHPQSPLGLMGIAPRADIEEHNRRLTGDTTTTQTHIAFHIGDGDSLPFILSRLTGSTITVTLKNGRYAVGDIIDPYYNGGTHLAILAGPDGGTPLDFAYDDIDSIEYA